MTYAGGKWLVNRTNPEYIDYISRAASVSPIMAQVLINRGLKSSEEIYSFLNPSLSNLTDPFELQDLKTAIQRINEAKKNSQRVLICGDYDADGITATAIMTEGLKKFGIDTHYFIPHRITHGYGFGISGVEKAKEIGAGLIITVDCGITSFEAVEAANSCGIDVIITDHHEPTRQSGVRGQGLGVSNEFLLPGALAIINPKIQYSNTLTPQSILSGAGITLKLIHGLFENNIDEIYELLDLAAIGTAADVVPLLGDNRVILKEGLKLIQSGNRTGIRALKKIAIKSDFFKTSFLYYILNPRINAAGRIADANDVVRLLTSKSEAETESLAKWIHDLNLQRQEIEETVYQEAIQKVESMTAMQSAIVVASEGWHPGVVGIVASRIAEKYLRPTFVFSILNGIAKGSGRSIPSFDIHSGLLECNDMLLRFGGHKQAAGLSLLSSDIERFRNKISEIAMRSIAEDELLPVLNIDATVSLSNINIELIDELSRLEPFGHCNKEPLFGAKGLEVRQPRIAGNNHLKMTLQQNGRSINCIGFDLGGLLETAKDSSVIDAAFLPMINEWDGGRYLQLNLKALRPAN